MSKCYKTCFVPTCINNNNRAPLKIYLSVPQGIKARKLWYEAVNLGDINVPSTPRFCCEDHFVLEEDTTNWLYFKTIGAKITLKPHVVPHRYINLPVNSPKRPAINYSQLTSKDRKLKKIKLRKIRKGGLSTTTRAFHEVVIKEVKVEEETGWNSEELEPNLDLSNHFTVSSNTDPLSSAENSESLCHEKTNNYGMVAFQTPINEMSGVQEIEDSMSDNASDSCSMDSCGIDSCAMDLLSKTNTEQFWGFIE